MVPAVERSVGYKMRHCDLKELGDEMHRLMGLYRHKASAKAIRTGPASLFLVTCSAHPCATCFWKHHGLYW